MNHDSVELSYLETAAVALMYITNISNLGWTHTHDYSLKYSSDLRVCNYLNLVTNTSLMLIWFFEVELMKLFFVNFMFLWQQKLQSV